MDSQSNSNQNSSESDSENPEFEPSADKVEAKRREKEGNTFQGSGKQVKK